MNVLNRAIKGTVSLTALKAIDYIFPLLIIPYAVSVLGVEAYGGYAYLQVFAIFGAFLTDFSYPTVAVQEVARKKSVTSVKGFVRSVLLLKLSTSVCIGVAIFAFIYTRDAFENYHLFILLIYFGLCFQNSWVYQGLEHYKPIMWFNAVGKLFACSLIPFFFTKKEDVSFFYMIQGLMYFLPGVASSVYLYKWSVDGKIRLFYIRLVFSRGLNVFIYRALNASVIPYTNQMVLFFGGEYVLGVYNIVVKFLSAASNVVSPVANSLIPIFSEAYDKNKEGFYRSFSKAVIVISLLSFLSFLALSLFISWYFSIELQDNTYDSVVFSIMFFTTIVPHALNSLYTQNLNLMGCSRHVRNMVIIFVVMMFLFIPAGLNLLPFYGVAIVNVVLYYGLLFSFMVLFSRKKDVKSSSRDVCI